MADKFLFRIFYVIYIYFSEFNLHIIYTYNILIIFGHFKDNYLIIYTKILTILNRMYEINKSKMNKNYIIK